MENRLSIAFEWVLLIHRSNWSKKKTALLFVPPLRSSMRAPNAFDPSLVFCAAASAPSTCLALYSGRGVTCHHEQLNQRAHTKGHLHRSSLLSPSKRSTVSKYQCKRAETDLLSAWHRVPGVMTFFHSDNL